MSRDLEYYAIGRFVIFKAERPARRQRFVQNAIREKSRFVSRKSKKAKYSTFPSRVRRSVNTPFPLSLVRHKHPIVASGAQIHTFQVFPFASCIKRLGSVLRYAANVFAKPDPISTIGRKHVMLNLRFVPSRASNLLFFSKPGMV